MWKRRWDLGLAAAHAALMVLALLYVVPIVPSLSYRSYKYFLQLAILTQGAPRWWCLPSASVRSLSSLSLSFAPSPSLSLSSNRRTAA